MPLPYRTPAPPPLTRPPPDWLPVLKRAYVVLLVAGVVDLARTACT